MERLATLIKKRNALDVEIAEILGRPVVQGHFGETVASRVFGLELHASANQRGSDGLFREGQFKDKSVNVKYYPMRENLLDISKENLPDFYLVLTGPKNRAASSRGGHLPWVIETVYLFDARDLVNKLKVKIGTATSVKQVIWEEAEIYPAHNPYFPLSRSQREMLKLFRSSRRNSIRHWHTGE